MVRRSTVLPAAVSPTIPSTSPCSSEMLRPSSVRIVPKWEERNSVVSSLTSSTATVSAPPGRIEIQPQAVADQRVAENDDAERNTREDRRPPLAGDQVLRAVRDHGSPLGGRRPDARADEGETSRDQDRLCHGHRGSHKRGADRVRQYVAEHHTERSRAADPSSLHIRPPSNGECRASRQTEEDGELE